MSVTVEQPEAPPMPDEPELGGLAGVSPAPLEPEWSPPLQVSVTLSPLFSELMRSCALSSSFSVTEPEPALDPEDGLPPDMARFLTVIVLAELSVETTS